MNDIQYKQKISDALQRFPSGELSKNAVHLLDVLGYRSDNQIDLGSNHPDAFFAEYDQQGNLNRDKLLSADWDSIDLLFQLTGDDLTLSNQRGWRFDSNVKQVNNTIIESYLFFALQLRNNNYTRTQLSQITREINKLFPMPVMLLFQHDQTLTFSIIDRRLHKRDESRDVLEKVTLIKDIDCSKPHRAHIEILFGLALEQLHKTHDVHNFVELHQAWKKTLDTSELNKRFFKEIADWYFWAVDQVTFPADVEKDKKIRNATNVIRLITRLIFVWFIKEKGLAQDTLFIKKEIDKILKNTDPQESSYYKAILQNLFFATLNTEMKPDNRKFRHRAKQSGGRDQHYMVHSLYRYERYFKHSKKALGFFKEIPFLNGGLFECLDKPGKDNSKKILRVDGFSDRNDNQLHVPNFLFFSDEQSVDLNAAYGTKGKRYKVRGLINILDRYKFTVAENTPIEEEVALDPELLGKVFENLLAAYNPETKTTARKLTGSFYTPREIVNYMTDESLIAYFKSVLISSYEPKSALSATTPPSQLDLTGQTEPVQSQLDIQKRSLFDKQKALIENNLRHLITYNDEPPRFSGEETEQLIKAIDDLKILDPACGSGEFPMGILRKLVFILGKLDPGNDQWRKRQIARVESTIETAEKIDDSTVRENTIRDLEKEIDNINEAFERNELDYGRKLYLIENCIYGVDIQPIAVQISKLRFFISLIIDQKIDDSRENRGVRPLPNLETKFVAANTLLSVDKPAQISIRNPQIDEKEKELSEVRRKHFIARTPRTKAKYRDQDDRIRAEISELLKRDGFPSETTEKIAYWNPYDQNAAANFFDPEWMFGIKNGFDVVIGNPPYGAKIDRSDLNKIKANVQDTKNSNSAALFVDYAKNRLIRADRQSGIVAFILPKSLLYSEKWHDLTFALLEKTVVLVDVENAFEKVKLEQVVVIYFAQCDDTFYVGRKFLNNIFLRTTHINKNYPNLFQAWICDVSGDEINLGSKIADVGTCLGNISKTTRGLPIQRSLAPRGDIQVIGGKEINRYGVVGVKGFVKRDYLDLTNRKVQLLRQPKVISQRLVAHIQNPQPHIKITSTVDKTGDILSVDTVENTIITDENFSPFFISALFNSTLINWYAYKFIFCSAIRTMDFDNYYVGKIPIPVATSDQQVPIVELVDHILITKATDSDADTSEEEAEIDQLVYALYGLTEEEIAIVEKRE